MTRAWTTDPPTVPGWYWHQGFKSRFKFIIWVSETHIKAVTFFKEDKWSGPIPEPQEPQKDT